MAELQSMEKEILTEIGNASINAASQSLMSFVSGTIDVQPPELELVPLQDVSADTTKGLLSHVVFSSGVLGRQYLFFPAPAAGVLASLLLGKEPPEQSPETLDEMEESALSEIVSMFMGVYTTSVAGFTGTSVEIDPPQSEFTALSDRDFNADGLASDEQLVALRFTLQFEAGHTATFSQYVPYAFMREIIAPLLPEEPAVETPTETPQQEESLPQDELAALLAEEDAVPKDEDKEPVPAAEASLDDMQKDVMAEIGNISLGASATALSELLNRRVQITTPNVSLTTMEEIRSNYPVPCLVVTVGYIKGLSGNNTLILSEEDALAIVGIMMGMEPPEVPPELGEIELSGISEAMNQMMGSAATAMSDFFNRLIDISPPRVDLKNLHSEPLDVSELDDEDIPVVKISFRMEVEGLLDSTLLQLIPLPFALEMANYLLSKMGFDVPEAADGLMGDVTAEPEIGAEDKDDSVMPGFSFGEEEKEEEEEDGGLLAGLESLISAATGEAPPAPSAPSPSSAPAADLEDFDLSRIDMIRDIPISIHVLLGKTRLPLKKVFSLLPGEIIALERYLGETVDIFANDRLVAKGEVVIVNGQFGIKIVDMLRT